MADYQAEYEGYDQQEADYSANGGNGAENQDQNNYKQEFQPDVGAKRSYDQAQQGGDGFTPAKRSRNLDENVDFRCLIPSRTAGGIIGRAGSVIKQMREDYKAQIHVHDNESDERVMQVSASIENCGKIVVQILPVITEGGRFQKGEEAPKFSLRMLVHQSQAGGIIGLKGLTIRDLRAKTGATIKVDQDCCPGSTDRICVISGTSDVVSNCIKSILELLLTIPPKGPIQNYDPGFCGDFGQPNDFGFQQFGDGGFRGGFRGRGGGGGGGGNFRGRGFDRGGNRGGGRGFNQGFGGFNRGGRGGGPPGGPGPRGGGPRGGRGFNRGQRGGPRGRGERGGRGRGAF